MNHAQQTALSKLTLAEFKLWLKDSKNADSLPCFFNSREEYTDEMLYERVIQWCKKYPYPPEDYWIGHLKMNPKYLPMAYYYIFSC